MMPRQTSAAAAADAASADSGEGQQVHIRSSAVLRVELAAVRPSVRGSCRAGGAAGVRVALRRVRIRRLRRVEPLEEMRRARRRVLHREVPRSRGFRRRRRALWGRRRAFSVRPCIYIYICIIYSIYNIIYI